MKRPLFALLAILLLLPLVSCSGAPAATGTEGETEAAPSSSEEVYLPRLSGAVSVGGFARAGDEVTPSLSARVRDEGLIFSWILNGKAVSAERNFRIPADAAGKELVLEVTAEGKAGKLVSEAVTVDEKGPETFYAMADLLPKVKWFGRSVTQNGAVTCDWSASGFEIRVETAGEAFQVGYETEFDNYFSVIVDGEEVLRPLCRDTGAFYVRLAPGTHVIRVLKDSFVDISGRRSRITNVGFDGTILDKAPDKTYIEIYGDSISCGSCARDTFEQGRVSTLVNHSATSAFAYVAMTELDADYSIICKGGIGLIQTSGSYNIPALLDYVNGYADRETKYDFTQRIPDVIIIELSANDSSVSTEEKYRAALASFIDSLREKYGKSPAIVWTSKNATHEGSMNSIIASRRGTDDRLYAFRYSYGTHGGAATENSTAGHPDVADHLAYGQALAAFLREKGLA